MAQKEHKLMSTPVSVNDGLKRADGHTWKILGLTALAALIVVAALNLFLPKPKIEWPNPQPAASAQPGAEEPRTHQVVPRQRAPKPN